MALYCEELQKMAKKHKTLLCFGLDPTLEEFPSSITGSTKQKIILFYSSIIDAAPKGSFSALKPNYAFFAQYGFEGLQALKELIDTYKDKYTIILDVKRGDIGRTARAYAKEGYEFFGADALTLSPLMGDDSIEPYFEYFAKGKGAYLLCRTSNAGAQDFLMQKMGDGRPLYKKIAEKTVEWDSSGSLGLVVGGTNISDLEEIFTMLAGAKKAIPLLIPGIGAQGGSAGRVANALAKHKMLAPLARVNASSSISYAFKKAETNDYLQAALDEMKSLNKEMKIEL